ncbi:hypothetical protein HID58_086602 [Brassica napus]|uniref:Asparagine synthetase domain-containing protein n=1 Tax=Brassica napus TaxID=3708 RepID=A0ABQ7XTI5_BRANA|nr:hypothetical protein HID58_086602 [Brassica napus]
MLFQVLLNFVRFLQFCPNADKGEKEVVPVAGLFSGGLDSMILAAALLDQCLDPKYEVDLLNVSFDGANALDRISAKAGIKELKKIAPLRRYKSEARILLVGAGADEQCAGYGRHRTKYRNGSWVALDQEMKLDMQRIWKRNLGRDDRRIADNGKEARFPFLDEDVIKTLLDIPLWEIADLEQPSGKGDKKILRQVAKLLGLPEVAKMPKRAIQFGSTIARESNRKNFGSNRAANQASAGSVRFHTQHETENIISMIPRQTTYC